MTTVYVIEGTEAQCQTQQVDFVPTGNVRWRNGPQTTAMTAAAFLFIAGGMEMALGLGWNINTYILTTHHFQYCWFIGVIAGAILAAPLIRFLPFRIYISISSLLVVTSGIIFVSVPYEYDAIIAARYISGVGIGFTIVASIVRGSEISAPSYRGAVLSTEQYALTLGIAIQVIYASQWTPSIDFAANRLHGIFIIVFTAFAASTIYLTFESPIFYLLKGDDESALEALRLLERPQIVTNSTKATLEDLKSYVTQERHQSFAESFRKSLVPFYKVLLYRSMVAFTFSVPLSVALELASFISLSNDNNWPAIVFVVLRVLGALIAIWLLDGLGRKLVPVFSLLCIGGLSIGYAIQFSKDSYVIDGYEMSIVCCLMLIAQFFAGLFTPSSSVYLGEAFSMNLKPYMIALCICVEQIIHIVTITTYDYSFVHNTFVYFITIGILSIVLSIYFFAAMPETRNTTLFEAQRRFRPFLHLKQY